MQLSAPAPAGGALIASASANPAVATVPASVSIPAGEAAATYQISPQQVLLDTPVNLQASYGGASVTTTLIVTPSSLRHIKLPFVTGSGNFPGGVTITGDVLINGLPPAEGAVIALQSSLPTAASVPASITANAPQWTPSFLVATSPVAAVTPVTITATWRGASVADTFTLYPPPNLTSPANGAAFSVGQLVRLLWGDQPFAYDVQIDDSSAFSAPLLVDTNTSTVEFYESSTLPSGTLHWRVRAVDAFAQKGPWSSSRSFTITGASGPLPAPVLSFPTNGARINAGQSVAFFWQAVAGAGSYELQVDNSSTIAAPFTINPTVIGSTQYTTSTLPRATLWWRVRALAPGGQPGAWSVVRSLEIR